MKNLLSLSLFAMSLCVSAQANAEHTSPIGVWKQIDDATGKPKSLIRITETAGEFKGKIEKLFREATEDQNPLCDKCEGELKSKPVIGMQILSGLKADGSEFTGGKILDPNNGKLYNSKLTLIEGGKKLQMRGYIGMPMLGRTQIWIREE